MAQFPDLQGMSLVPLKARIKGRVESLVRRWSRGCDVSGRSRKACNGWALVGILLLWSGQAFAQYITRVPGGKVFAVWGIGAEKGWEINPCLENPAVSCALSTQSVAPGPVVILGRV
jgi:hypothetical protein